MERFRQLQQQLINMYGRIFPDPLAQRTVVVVPSLSLDVEELAKIEGVHHYEERMLCLLMLLQMPNTSLIYITSQPISPTVTDYFLHLLPGIPSIHAKTIEIFQLLRCVLAATGSEDSRSTSTDPQNPGGDPTPGIGSYQLLQFDRPGKGTVAETGNSAVCHRSGTGASGIQEWQP